MGEGLGVLDREGRSLGDGIEAERKWYDWLRDGGA